MMSNFEFCELISFLAFVFHLSVESLYAMSFFPSFLFQFFSEKITKKKFYLSNLHDFLQHPSQKGEDIRVFSKQLSGVTLRTTGLTVFLHRRQGEAFFLN